MSFNLPRNSYEIRKKIEATLQNGEQGVLDRGQVKFGETYTLKGDAQYVLELETAAQSIKDKKLQQAQIEVDRLIDEAKLNAHQLIEDARQQGEAMVAEAKSQEEAIKAKAYEDGYQDGFAKGTTDATNQVEAETVDLLQTAHTVLNGAYEAESFVLKEFQADALSLVKHVTNKILATEIQQKPEYIAQFIEQAITALYLTGKVKVVLGQKYLDMMRAFTPKTQALIESMKRFEWAGDPLMGPDEIHIISSEGAFAISADVQVDALLSPIAGQLPLTAVPLPSLSMSAHEQTISVSELAEGEPEVLLNEELSKETPEIIITPSTVEDIAIPSFESLEVEAKPDLQGWELQDLESVMAERQQQEQEPEFDVHPEAVAVEFPDLETLLPLIETESENDEAVE